MAGHDGGRVGWPGDEAGRTLEQQIAVHREAGWTRIELRTLADRPIHALTRSDLARAAEHLGAANLGVCALASPIGNWERPVSRAFADDLELLDAALTAAVALGTTRIRIMSYPNDGLTTRAWREAVIARLSELTRRAAAVGVTLLLENCAGYAAHDPERMLELLDAVGDPALRVLFDTGNPVVHGADGLHYLRRVLPFVEHIHVKDAKAPTASRPAKLCAPGDGDARVADCVGAALASGFAGCLVAEPEVARVTHRRLTAPDGFLRQSFLAWCENWERLLLSSFPNYTLEGGTLDVVGATV